MNLKKGEIWVCEDPYCAAEIEVIRAANTTCHGKYTLRCCCGKEMTLQKPAGHEEPVAAAAGAESKTGG